MLNFPKNIYNFNISSQIPTLTSCVDLKPDRPGDSLMSDSKIPANIYRANFMPVSFGRFSKVGEVDLVERKSGRIQKAILKKDSVYGYTQLKLIVKGKEAGFLDMCSPLEPKYPALMDRCSELSEVLHIRSLMGDKYSGIGTALMDSAIQISRKNGTLGNLCLYAETGYAKGLSAYRRGESPLPFYYNYGFFAVDPKIDSIIKTGLSSKEFDKLPPSALLVLSSEARDRKVNDLINNPMIYR